LTNGKVYVNIITTTKQQPAAKRETARPARRQAPPASGKNAAPRDSRDGSKPETKHSRTSGTAQAGSRENSRPSSHGLVKNLNLEKYIF
jgi:hypothetical protein